LAAAAAPDGKASAEFMSAYLQQSVSRTYLSPQPDDSSASPSQLRARVMHAEAAAAAAAAEEGFARSGSGGGEEKQQEEENVHDGRTESTAGTMSSRQPHAARSLSFAESPPTPTTALVHTVGGGDGGQGPHMTTVARASQQRRVGSAPGTAAKPNPRSSSAAAETTPATAMVMRQLYPTELHTAESFQGFAGSFRTMAPGSGGGGVPRQLVERASHHKVCG
jgi:hypothetical protein